MGPRLYRAGRLKTLRHPSKNETRPDADLAVSQLSASCGEPSVPKFRASWPLVSGFLRLDFQDRQEQSPFVSSPSFSQSSALVEDDQVELLQSLIALSREQKKKPATAAAVACIFFAAAARK